MREPLTADTLWRPNAEDQLVVWFQALETNQNARRHNVIFSHFLDMSLNVD